jgi:hypothetical protein
MSDLCGAPLENASRSSWILSGYHLKDIRNLLGRSKEYWRSSSQRSMGTGDIALNIIMHPKLLLIPGQKIPIGILGRLYVMTMTIRFRILD